MFSRSFGLAFLNNSLTASLAVLCRLFSKSQFGKISSVNSLTQSLYTDVISRAHVTTTVYMLQLDVEIKSGVGKNVFVDMEGINVEERDSMKKSFRLVWNFSRNKIKPTCNSITSHFKKWAQLGTSLAEQSTNKQKRFLSNKTNRKVIEFC